MTDFEDDEATPETNFDRLLRESSLGSPAARRLRSRVGDDQVQWVRRLAAADAGESSITTTPVDNPAALPAARDAGWPAVEADQKRVELHDDLREAESADCNAMDQTGDRQVTGGALVLSERERQILRLLAVGRPVADIAAELFVAPATVITHIQRLRERLGVADHDAAAVTLAMQNQLLE